MVSVLASILIILAKMAYKKNIEKLKLFLQQEKSKKLPKTAAVNIVLNPNDDFTKQKN